MPLIKQGLADRVVFPIVAAVVASLFTYWILAYWRESPSLEVAGPVRVDKDVVEVPLRTRCEIPVVVFGYWVRGVPKCGANLSDEKPITIDADALPINKWVWTEIDPFQVKRDDVSKLPLRIHYLNNRHAVEFEVQLGYGDPEKPRSLFVASLTVNRHRE